MTNREAYDKKKLIILRAVLIALGAAVGATAMWQYFAVYPDVLRKEIMIVVIVVSAVVLAALLGLSAKPLYRLGASIGAQFIKLTRELGAKGVTAAIAGLVGSAAIGYLFDFTVRNAITIVAVRVLADVVVTVLFAVLACYCFVKYIEMDVAGEEISYGGARSGYLFTAQCFFDDRVYAAVEFTGGKVTSGAFKALWKYGDSAAIERFRTITESGAVDVLRTADDFASPEEYVRADGAFALSRRLRPVDFDSGVFPAMEGAARLAAFALPDAALIDGYKARAAKAEDAAETEAPAGETPNGQIIIDK